MPKRLTLADCQAVAEARGGKCLSTEYTRCADNYLWECSRGHRWAANFDNVKNKGQWCLRCSGSYKLTIEECQSVAKSRGGKCLTEVYVNRKTKMLWECEKGHKWESTFGSIKGQNTWCPRCAGKQKLTLEDCQELAKSRGGRCLSTVCVKGSDKQLWECKEGHKWEASLSNIKNDTRWCPVCGGSQRLTLEECQSVAKSRGGKCLSTEYVNNDTKMKWQCSKGHQWETIFNNIKSSGTWCPVCSSDKRKQTVLERYGVEYVIQSKQVKDKAKQTCLDRYGVEHPAQKKEIALKAARSFHNTSILIHWKTGEELVCVASYEKAVVEYFNANKIDFLWQSKVFKMKNGKTYRPDCYLLEEDLWIEIKGYFRESAKVKWNWFQKEYPNSELWDKKKLKELKIL